MPTVADILQLFHTSLDALYDANEVETFARLALEHHSGIPYSSYLSHKPKELPVGVLGVYNSVVSRLTNFEPVQYILGTAAFYGLDFTVDSNVLIPRPETEELVDRILKENTGPLRIADICTGSGCIAISLKHNLPQAEVWATDFSDGALAVAAKNAEALKVAVNIIKHNALSNDYEALTGQWDIWVSNPPYIKLSEKESILPNVLNYEPHMALFVPNDDALLFYRQIAVNGLAKLKPGGRLYFETHTDHAQEVANLLSQLGYNSCKIVKDMSGRDRMVTAVKI